MAYIYEYIRTQGYEPIHFEEHYTRLKVLSERLFHARLNTTPEELKEAISDMLRNEGYSSHTINCVYIRYYDNGEVKLETVEIIYNTFSLRAIRPQGYICYLSGDMLIENTSAKEAMLELNHSTIQTPNSEVPIWVGEGGSILAIDGAPIVAVFEDEIRFSEVCGGVEFDIAMQNMSAPRRKISKCTITLDDLDTAKEVLYIDHRGITALVGWNNRHYTDITAERIARTIAEAE